MFIPKKVSKKLLEGRVKRLNQFAPKDRRYVLVRNHQHYLLKYQDRNVYVFGADPHTKRELYIMIEAYFYAMIDHT